jgi:hypothetical protein
MPARAKGSLRHRFGSVVASVPGPFGTTGRIERSFPDEECAKRWVAECLAARVDGRPYPDAAGYQQAVARVVALESTPRPFGEVAWAWWREVYVEDRRASPKRRNAVEAMLRRRIVPFFDTRLTRIDEMRRDHVRQFVRYLAGHEPLPSSERPRHVSAVTETSFTITQAAEHCGVSRSTIRRYWLKGSFPNAARRDGGRDIVIPLVDLAAAGLTDRSVTFDTRSTARALSKSTASGHLAIVREVIAYAMANKEMEVDPSHGIGTLPPNQDRTPHQPSTSKKYVFEYPVCAKVVRHLHIHHVVAFWIQRVVGLRVGEVFGLHVDDLGDFEEFGLLNVSRQGGRKLLAYDQRGDVVERHEVERLKTASSSRVIAIPRPLLELLRVYINAFHTDPDTGDINQGARLILGLRNADAGGVSAYRTALHKAFAAEGLTFEQLGFSASTHHLRASLGGELKLQLAIDEMIRSEILGHLVRPQGGAAVTMRSYTPALAQLEPFIAVAKVQGPFITEQIDSLFIPISRPHPLGPVSHLSEERLAAARSILDEAGLIATETGLVTFTEAVRILGTSRGVLHRAIESGKIHARTVEHPVGGPLLQLRLDDVMAFKFELQPEGDFISTEQAAQMLAISQWSLARMIKMGTIAGTLGANRQYLVDRAAVERRREDLTRLAALHERAVRLGEAAAKLQLSTDATKRLLKAGKLDEDPDTGLDPAGGYYVTLASIERYQAELEARAERARRSATLSDDWILLEDVIAASGQTRVELLALSGKGLIVKRDRKYKFFVHRESPMLPSILTGQP